ncbi:amidase [Lichenihabitans sp. Uapishka_5]|uniref:amidase n=1 Tax=Lichenihabitans sp. Uapishka_5 TaxID=3037302 RepID=UPI0029E81B53|nr:amidase [Lichenihabitans sp. Uapishka_5]MDX7951306.1 amidase [Lichenihabitans sp. Uapishka_5]
MIPVLPDGPPAGAGLGAFVPGPRLIVDGAPDGPLAGLSFAAKDLFDVAGHVTGCGNPDWAASHAAAATTAAAVRCLLAAGARLVGKTVTDEISLGLLGRNRHVGAPVNPRAPDRYTGGSSSGSAAAVAAGLVPIALGSDSGGSMRVPASFCGIYGLRPTHGAISVDGLMVQAPSFDTAGFFAAAPEAFARVGDVLLPRGEPGTVDEVLVADDAFARADAVVRETLRPAVDRVAAVVGGSRSIGLADEGLDVWNRHHVHLQHPEFAATFAPWVDAVDPRLSFDVAAAIATARLLPEAPRRAAQLFRTEVRARVDALLNGRRILCLPTTPILPPRRDLTLAQTATVGQRLVDLTCIAGMTGLPQVSLPLAEVRGLPVGLSLIGWRGGDRALLELARRMGGGP